MKILNQTSDVEIVGQVESNRVGIDVKNIDFITQILSTNLYSNPMESYLREAISNARDSHKEAGTEKPIVLDIGMNQGKLYVRIQDFGTGISKERFDSIYRFIGSSTKRDSNEYIGGFGIGKFASLAVSDTVYITSNHNGTQVKYLMYRDGSAIKIDELSSAPTKEENGLDILAYTKGNITNNINTISDALQKLVHFNNLYVNVSLPNDISGGDWSYDSARSQLTRLCAKFNARTLVDHGTFVVPSSLDSYRLGVYALLGDVVYPIKPEISEWIKRVNGRYGRSCNLGIKFNIGELDVTPNREELLYNSKTNAALSSKIIKVYDDLCKGCADKLNIKSFVEKGTLNSALYSILFMTSTNYSLGPDNNIDLLTVDVRKNVIFNGKILDAITWEGLRTLSNDVDLGTYQEKASYNKNFKSEGEFKLCTLSSGNLYQKEGNMKASYRAYLANTHGNHETIKVLTFDDTELKTFPNCNTESIKIFNDIIDAIKKDIPVLSDDTIPETYKDTSTKASVLTGNIKITFLYSDWDSTTVSDPDWYFTDSDTRYVYCNEAEVPIGKILSRVADDCIDDPQFKNIRFFTVPKKHAERVTKFTSVIQLSDLLKADANWAIKIKTKEALIEQFKNTGINISEFNPLYIFSGFPGYKSLVEKLTKARIYINHYYSSVLELATNLGATIDDSVLKKYELNKEEKLIVKFGDIIKNDKDATNILYALLTDNYGAYADSINKLKQLVQND